MVKNGKALYKLFAGVVEMQMASLLQGKMKHRRWKMQEKAINMMLKRGCYWKKKRGWVKHDLPFCGRPQDGKSPKILASNVE